MPDVITEIFSRFANNNYKIGVRKILKNTDYIATRIETILLLENRAISVSDV